MTEKSKGFAGIPAAAAGLRAASVFLSEELDLSSENSERLKLHVF